MILKLKYTVFNFKVIKDICRHFRALSNCCNLILSQKSHSVNSDNVVGDQEAECSCCKNGHDDKELIHLRLLETNDLKFIDD